MLITFGNKETEIIFKSSSILVITTQVDKIAQPFTYSVKSQQTGLLIHTQYLQHSERFKN